MEEINRAISIRALKEITGRDQNICPCLDDQGRSACVNAAVNNDVPLELAADILDLGEDRRHEFLARKSWIHGHNKNTVNNIQHTVQALRRPGVDSHAGLFPHLFDVQNVAPSLIDINNIDFFWVLSIGPTGRPPFAITLGMKANAVSACGTKGIDIIPRVLDHKVGFYRKLRDPAYGLNNDLPDRDVGHEMAVHHINVNAINTATLTKPQISLQIGEIGGKNTGRNMNLHKDLNKKTTLVATREVLSSTYFLLHVTSY